MPVSGHDFDDSGGSCTMDTATEPHPAAIAWSDAVGTATVEEKTR